MEKIIRDNSYSVGVTKLDEQHMKIIDTINLLMSNPEATVQSEPVSDILDRMTKYSIEHFRTEEEFLQEMGYPGLDDQKAEHKAYRLKVVALCQATVMGDVSVPEDLLEFISDWWVEHILESDMAYKGFVARRGQE